MPKLALVLSGAVSLGSWEAGVLDELLYQLDRLNAVRDEPNRFVLDVIAGASAGAMTAAMVARAVMVDFDDRRWLREAWVDEIDIAGLLRAIPTNALLSKDPIEDITTRCLAVPATARPASMAPERLLMRFTLTNMSGVDYALPANRRPGSTRPDFVTTFHAERRQFELNRTNLLDPDTWEDLREAAIASGSFPFAFHPHRLRSMEEPWPGHALSPFPDEFTYIDGGVFNNEPLGEAVRLARQLDGSAEQPGIDPDRIFLLVDASLNASRHDAHFSDLSSLPESVFRTLAVVLGESSAMDWLRARRLNNEVAWRDELLAVLAGLVTQIPLSNPVSFLATLDGAADRIVGQKRALFPGRYSVAYREHAVERTLAANEELTEGMGPERRRIFGALAFLLNSVSGLDKKSELDLHVIYSTPGETAGDRLFGFAGFLSHEWRLHDYLVGRTRASEELPWILEGGSGSYEGEPGVGYDPPLQGDVDIDDAPRAVREQLRDAVVGKAAQLSRNLDPGPAWLRWATGPLARWAVRRWAKGRVEEALKL